MVATAINSYPTPPPSFSTSSYSLSLSLSLPPDAKFLPQLNPKLRAVTSSLFSNRFLPLPGRGAFWRS